MKDPNYRSGAGTDHWRDLGPVESLKPVFSRDPASGWQLRSPAAISAEGDLLVVFDEEGGVAFVTDALCPHQTSLRRLLSEEIGLGAEAGTLTCAHRGNSWSRRDGQYLGSKPDSCGSMATYGFRVDGGRLMILVPAQDMVVAPTLRAS